MVPQSFSFFLSFFLHAFYMYFQTCYLNKKGQFQLFDMSDAAEALEAILSFIHTVYILTEVTTGFVHDHSQLETLNDIPCDFHCVSHNTFGWRCLSFKECFSCQSRSDSILTDQFIIRVHAADLMESFAYQQSENSNSTHSVSRTFAIDSSQYSLARVMQSISSYPCPSNGVCHFYFYFLFPPPFSLYLVTRWFALSWA